MATRRELTDFERGMIIGARRMGHSISEVTREFGFPRSTVSRVDLQYRRDNVTTRVNRRTGRPQVFNERTSRRLSRTIRGARRATVSQITAQLNVGSQEPISTRTVRRHLHRLGFTSRRPTRVPLLTPRHRAQRRAWAREHRQWTMEQWRRVVWSDESRFQLYRADGRVRVWRMPHEAMDPACQQGCVQAGGGSVMVWAAFSWSQLGPIVRLQGALTGARYVDILSDHLHPFLALEYPDGDAMFQQDNAPCHRSVVSRWWLEEHSSEVTTMEWPSRSPDLNPIEHLWDAVDAGVRSMNPALTTQDQLWVALQDAWVHIPPERFQHLVESMPHRIAAVLRARGGATRY